MSMRLVLDARTVNDHFPGIGRYVVGLARALVPFLAQGEEMILLRDPTHSSTLDLMSLVGDRVRILDVPISPFSPRQQWTLPRLLRRLRADVYHSPYYLTPYWPGVPSVVTIHDLIPLRYPEYYTPFQRLIYGVSVRLAARTAQRVLADSQSAAYALQYFMGLSEARIRVIPAAADSTFCVRTTVEVKAIRDKYDLPEEYVLHLSSSKPHKNLVRLVDAWALLEERGETFGHSLALAGQMSPRYPEARDRIRMLSMESRVRLLGRIPDSDLPALYSGASWFVFPSLYEGFGLPVLEAMACGTPVICSNTSSLPEVVGDAAITFDPVDTEGMTEALAHALADSERAKEMGKKALQQARKFSWERTARLAYQCYQDVII